MSWGAELRGEGEREGEGGHWCELIKLAQLGHQGGRRSLGNKRAG